MGILACIMKMAQWSYGLWAVGYIFSFVPVICVEKFVWLDQTWASSTSKYFPHVWVVSILSCGGLVVIFRCPAFLPELCRLSISKGVDPSLSEDPLLAGDQIRRLARGHPWEGGG